MNFGILGYLKVSLEFSWTNSGDGTDFQQHQNTYFISFHNQTAVLYWKYISIYELRDVGYLKVSLEFSWTNFGDGTDFQHHENTYFINFHNQTAVLYWKYISNYELWDLRAHKSVSWVFMDQFWWWDWFSALSRHTSQNSSLSSNICNF